MNYLYPHARLLIFAKAPIPGQAKTRLIPLLGEQGAAELHAQLLRHTVEMACAAAVAPVELWLAGDWEPGRLEDYSGPYPLSCHRQQGEDLGERMAHAAGSGSSPLVIIGSDCPVMGAEVLRQAFAGLEGHAVVFQPAEDGGYTLIGLRDAFAGLFRGIDWGSPQVLEQSLQRARELGLEVELLEMSWDLDRAEDYRRAMALGLLNPIDTSPKGPIS